MVADPPLPLLMGIVNVTDDSFSDGGKYIAPEAAIAHALDLEKQGADILDIGGESTRPGSEPIAADREIGRIVPVISELAAKAQAPISIDTMKASVAAAALDAGARLINDVSAGQHDGEMFSLVADRGCPLILMHMLGQPKTMQNEPHYDNLMDELHRFFEDRLSAAVKAGISESRLIIDPGIGFGKSMSHNYVILKRLRELLSFGRPVLVGLSRKSLLKNDLGKLPTDRLEESVTAQTVAVMNGATMLRVHDLLPAVKSRAIMRRTWGTA
ncbi:MAG: dihydropteroate synthase [Candidatus Marinimicrobia bacterium]|nr:dihydropteroate synthase [Candidatus Neomarinimicrobiota bacterium]